MEINKLINKIICGDSYDIIGLSNLTGIIIFAFIDMKN